jgi:hypothetical protein
MSRFLLIAAAFTLTACAPIAPTAPSLLALPGQGKTLEQFTADDIGCRGYAQGRQPAGETMAMAEDLQRRYDVAYVQCMYAKGHKVPVPGIFAGKPAGEPPVPPPPPAPSMIPPLVPPASQTPQPETSTPPNQG